MRTIATIALCLSVLAACSSTSSNPSQGAGGATGSGGANGSGGRGAGGTTVSAGGSVAGGTKGSGGNGGSGGDAAGGVSETGGRPGTGGSQATGGTMASGGGGVGGGAAGLGGVGVGGAPGSGGAPGQDGGPGDGGGSDVGRTDAGGGGLDAGTGGASSFDPCPATDACKVLPLGDSITWGVNYGGGYRIKLFTHTVTDGKTMTFVGYDSANPPDATTLSKLGSASSKWVGKHEGHSGWTIQQDDDLVTGKSTANNDGVNYTGKKVVADFGPNIVLVHLGTNDMYQNPNGADTRLGTLIDHIVADAPNALVVVASIIPFPSQASTVNTFNKAVPGVVKQRADAGKHVVYVDMYSALTPSDLGSDQIHPNEGGYEKMAMVWYNAIKPSLH